MPMSYKQTPTQKPQNNSGKNTMKGIKKISEGQTNLFIY